MAQPKQARAKHARPAKTPAPHRTGAGGADASKAVRGGIAQPVTPSPELGAIVGMAPLSRAEVTKRVWAYIKAHDLQDAQDRTPNSCGCHAEKGPGTRPGLDV